MVNKQGQQDQKIYNLRDGFWRVSEGGGIVTSTDYRKKLKLVNRRFDAQLRSSKGENYKELQTLVAASKIGSSMFMAFRQRRSARMPFPIITNIHYYYALPKLHSLLLRDNKKNAHFFMLVSPCFLDKYPVSSINVGSMA